MSAFYKASTARDQIIHIKRLQYDWRQALSLLAYTSSRFLRPRSNVNTVVILNFCFHGLDCRCQCQSIFKHYNMCIDACRRWSVQANPQFSFFVKLGTFLSMKFSTWHVWHLIDASPHSVLRTRTMNNKIPEIASFQ